jgi:quercetin dioxygenase-like cupin family protein
MEWLADDRISPTTGLSLARMTVQAGATSPAHSHPDCTEVIHVLEGEIEQRIGDAVHRIATGATCVVPPGAIHASRAIGPGDAVLIVAYSSGTRTYRPA